MPDPVGEPPVESLVARLETLERELGRVRERLAALEAGRGGEDAPLAASLRITPEPVVAPQTALDNGNGWPARAGADASLHASGLLTLVGRTLLVLAGGFMIRALTDAGLLPALAGVALGLAYALFWIARADREARAGETTSAVFQGAAGGLIAYPLLWETTTRFRLLDTSLALGAAWCVRRFRRLTVTTRSCTWARPCFRGG